MNRYDKLLGRKKIPHRKQRNVTELLKKSDTVISDAKRKIDHFVKIKRKPLTRYDLALKKFKTPSKIVGMKSTQNSVEFIGRLKRFANSEYIVKASKIPEYVVLGSLIQISKVTRVPIIVPSNSLAYSISISYSYDKIYSVDSASNCRVGILYNVPSETVSGIRPYLVVLR